MEKYYKIVEGDYVLAIGTGIGGVEITEEEYNTILQALYTGPTPEDGYDYKLKTDLTWELVELPTKEEE